MSSLLPFGESILILLTLHHVFSLCFSPSPLSWGPRKVTLWLHPRCKAGAEQEIGGCSVLPLLGCSVLSWAVIFLAVVPPAISTVTVPLCAFSLTKSEQPPTFSFWTQTRYKRLHQISAAPLYRVYLTDFISSLLFLPVAKVFHILSLSPDDRQPWPHLTSFLTESPWQAQLKRGLLWLPLHTQLLLSLPPASGDTHCLRSLDCSWHEWVLLHLPVRHDPLQSGSLKLWQRQNCLVPGLDPHGT